MTKFRLAFHLKPYEGDDDNDASDDDDNYDDNGDDGDFNNILCTYCEYKYKIYLRCVKLLGQERGELKNSISDILLTYLEHRGQRCSESVRETNRGKFSWN